MFSGGISNSNTIVAAIIAILLDGVSTFTGDITNSGTIFGGGAINHAAIIVKNGELFDGGIVTSLAGLISSGRLGIRVENYGTFSGGISNAGTIAARDTAILVGSFDRSPPKSAMPRAARSRRLGAPASSLAASPASALALRASAAASPMRAQISCVLRHQPSS